MKLHLAYDPCCESPNKSMDDWKLHSFHPRHVKTKTQEDLFPNGKIPIWLLSKLRAGTAFFLDLYEHGGSHWSISGHGNGDQWDSTSCAGILIWERELSGLGPKTFEARQKNAELYLDLYNDWANGQCFYYTLNDDASAGGHIGMKAIKEALLDNHPDLFHATKDGQHELNKDVEVEGEAGWITKYW